MNNIYRPYTYLIGWSKLNVWYYGARSCNSVSQGIANPSDLWVSYFTSSKVVKEFRRKHGDPDVIEVRHTFTDRSKALLWEDGVLSSIPEVSRIQWLNRRFGDTFKGVALEKFSPEHCAKISASKVGKKMGPRSEATRLKISQSLKVRFADCRNNSAPSICH